MKRRKVRDRMQKIYAIGDKKKCVVCHRKTVRSYEYGYIDGICIQIPVCQNCKKDVGMCLDLSMDAHLKGINNAVVMSRIITDDEKRLQEIYRKERANER